MSYNKEIHPLAEAFSLSFVSTNIRRRLKLPDPIVGDDWNGLDFIRYDLKMIEQALDSVPIVGYKDEV